MANFNKLLSSLFEWVQIIIFSVILAVLINLFIIQPIKVEGKSMYPTLYDNDFVIISRLGKTFNVEMDYGDIVVIDRRTDRKRTIFDDIKELSIFNRFENKNLWIKRLIGKPGDVIEIRAGVVYRNGQQLSEPYIREPMRQEPDEIYIVPEGHLFVMGDNRNQSMDSRRIGYVPMENVKGKMILDISKFFR